MSGQVYLANKATSEFYREANFHSLDEITTLLNESGYTVVDRQQTVYSLDNVQQPVKPGHGDGVFVAMLTSKQ